MSLLDMFGCFGFSSFQLDLVNELNSVCLLTGLKPVRQLLNVYIKHQRIYDAPQINVSPMFLGPSSDVERTAISLQALDKELYRGLGLFTTVCLSFTFCPRYGQ